MLVKKSHQNMKQYGSIVLNNKFFNKYKRFKVFPVVFNAECLMYFKRSMMDKIKQNGASFSLIYEKKTQNSVSVSVYVI